MKRRNLYSLLIILWITLAACSAGQPGVVTIEVPHIVREIQYVTVEVPRIEREIQFATIEVTRIVRETVVVTPEAPGQWRLDVAPGISLGTPRMAHTATRLLDGRILLAGGGDGRDAMYTLVEIFDPASGVLIPAAPLNTPRSGHTATLLADNRVLVVGGYNAQQGWLADAELYDPLLNAWMVVPTLYSHGVQHSATLLADGSVLVTGGCIASGVCSDRAERFDPQSNTWSETAPLPTDLGSHAAALLGDGRVLVAGGAGSAGPAGGGTGYLYDPLTNTWSATGAVVTGRVQAPLVKLLDGRVLFVGGISVSDNPNVLSSAEIYNPASNSWTEAAGLAQPRYGHALELLADGQVIVLGGARAYDYTGSNPWTQESFIRLIQSYNPVTDRWTQVGELQQPEAYAATVLLPDGRLWLTGGGAGADMAKAWADTWLITPQPLQP